MPEAGKRTRLIEAAKLVMYQQGTHRTTLAHVAIASSVPLGNVYYYFRTRDALVEAVIKSRQQEIRSMLHTCETQTDPLQRLKTFANSSYSYREQLVRYGCPYASLCLELEKENNTLSQDAAELFQLQLLWAEKQFHALGFSSEATHLAVDLIAGMQGAYLLAHSQHSVDLLERKLARLTTWLDELTRTQQNNSGIA